MLQQKGRTMIWRLLRRAARSPRRAAAVILSLAALGLSNSAAVPALADTTSTFTPGAAWKDTSGTAYLLSEDRAHGLRIDELSANYLSVASAVAVLPDYEAPGMFKIGSTYYLLASHLTGWAANDDVYATAGISGSVTATKCRRLHAVRGGCHGSGPLRGAAARDGAGGQRADDGGDSARRHLRRR
jgi:hypothetical protein